MFELTDAAGQELHKSLARIKIPGHEGKCFRVVPKNHKLLTLKLTKPAASDATFEHKGRVVLALPKAVRSSFRLKSLGVDQSGKLKLN